MSHPQAQSLHHHHSLIDMLLAPQKAQAMELAVPNSSSCMTHHIQGLYNMQHACSGAGRATCRIWQALRLRFRRLSMPAAEQLIC
jgi:hypothetical protein